MPQDVTFTCSFCHSEGKLIDIGKMFGLQTALLLDSIDHSLN